MEAMLDGDFERAWRVTDGIEAPRRAGVCEATDSNLLWDGTPVEGRKVLVRCWHGLGDSIQFLRFVPMLRARAAEVFVDLQPELRGIFPDLTLADSCEGAVEIESMELPYLLRVQRDEIPARTPYVAACRGRRFLDPGAARKVGVVWAAGEWNPARSLPLAQLAPVAEVPGVELYSLQQGARTEELKDVGFRITPLDATTRDLTALASAMLELDLVISVDSMTAHLAGALGRPVWTLLRRNADWRWMRDREDSPWYPTMRLFRQAVEGEWAGVVQKVVAELSQSRQFAPD